MRRLVIAATALLSTSLAAQRTAPPIIDMHLHASRVADFAALGGGKLPMPHCVPMTSYPVPATGEQWGAVFRSPNPRCHATWSAKSDDELLQQTLATMRRRNIVGLTSGPQTLSWVQAAPERFIPSLAPGDGYQHPSSDSMRVWFGAKRYTAIGELAVQYSGLTPDDTSLRALWTLAEELDIPVGIHIGTGPVGAPYMGPFPNYRARLHSPLLIEEVLVRHPKLRVWIMHAGWPMLDDLLAVMWTHPQVYVDVGVIDWAVPRKEFHRYLERIVDAGFGKRVMFGSDQMVWPATIEIAIQSIESATFLTAEQKRDILYNNAARFLRLSSSDLAKNARR